MRTSRRRTGRVRCPPSCRSRSRTGGRAGSAAGFGEGPTGVSAPMPASSTADRPAASASARPYASSVSAIRRWSSSRRITSSASGARAGQFGRVEFPDPLQDLVGGRNAGRVGFRAITGRLPSAVHSTHRGISARVNAAARQKSDRTHVCLEKAAERSKLYVSVPETPGLLTCPAMPRIRGPHFPPAGSSTNRTIFGKGGKDPGVSRTPPSSARRSRAPEPRTKRVNLARSDAEHVPNLATVNRYLPSRGRTDIHLMSQREPRKEQWIGPVLTSASRHLDEKPCGRQRDVRQDVDASSGPLPTVAGGIARGKAPVW